MVGKPVVDATGTKIGTIRDVAIATGEIFPRVTSLAFSGPDKTPLMLSWRKYVDDVTEDQVTLNAPREELRFSYQQPDEVLLARDLLNKQIVDTQGMKVVRVNDLKLAESRNQLRLLGADVGVAGLLRALSPRLEGALASAAKAVGRPLHEDLIAWNYMDLLDRDLSQVRLSVTHKRLHELHPADMADILEQLAPSQRAKVFEHLDDVLAADAISAMGDEYQAEVVEDLGNQRASDILELMDPDDAADIVGDLPYAKAEQLLRLMGVKEQTQVRALLGYKDKTAGGIMTSEITTVTPDMTIGAVIEYLRGEASEYENIYYVYVVDDERHLLGVVSLRDLIVGSPDTRIETIYKRDVITVDPDDDQEDTAETMSKYDLLALPVVDESGVILGMVTVDDALDVLEEESAEDLALASGTERFDPTGGVWKWVGRHGWLWVWGAVALIAAIIVRLAPQPGPVLTLLLLSLALLPPFLRLSEDIAARAVGRLIDDPDDEDAPSWWAALGADALGGLLLALVAAAVAIGLAAITAPQGTSPFTEIRVIGPLAGLAAATVFVVTLAGTAIGALARRWAAREHRVSATGVYIALMAAATVVFVAFATLAAMYLTGVSF
jgi:Mg/Co/Ni transporter MgtE/sporulation protein YlmC with PRC-barrel domain